MRKVLTPWRVQKHSDIGIFLRKRARPLRKGQLRKHFSILSKFGKNTARINELKAFARLSPEAMAKFLGSELGIRVKTRSLCDEKIKKLVKDCFEKTCRVWDRLDAKMHGRRLSRSDFINLFKRHCANSGIGFKQVAEDLHTATHNGLLIIARKVGASIIPEHKTFTASAELKKLLSEVLADSSSHLSSTQEVRHAAVKLLNILSDTERIKVLEQAQKEREETIRRWLGISKAGAGVKRKTEKPLVRKHTYLKSRFSQRAIEKQRLRRERQAFPKTQSL